MGLLDALAKAKTGDEALAIVCRAEVGASVTPPTIPDLAAWLPEGPEEAKVEANKHLQALARLCEPKAPNDGASRPWCRAVLAAIPIPPHFLASIRPVHYRALNYRCSPTITTGE